YRSIEVPLRAGSYRVTAGTTGSRDGAEVGAAAPLVRHFDVETPRFALAATEVAGVFPPRNARGEFAETIAHLVLGRRTLPWERVHVDTDPPPVPWLALLVFEDGEPFAVRPNAPLSSIVPTDVYAALAPPGDVLCDAVDVQLGKLFELMPS